VAQLYVDRMSANQQCQSYSIHRIFIHYRCSLHAALSRRY